MIHSPFLAISLAVACCCTIACSSPVVKTEPGTLTDTTRFTITCDAGQGNKGLKDFSGPVYIHAGVITDSSLHPNDWRHVKFTWGSVEETARATPAGTNKWTYTIPGIRRFFNVPADEKIIHLAVLFRQGSCIDTFCKVLRNKDGTDMLLAVSSD